MEYDEKALVVRARTAYFKAGEMDQPVGGGDVEVIDGVPHVVLRNTQGILAVYSYDGKNLKRMHEWPDQLN